MGLILLPVHIIEVIFSKLPISNFPVCRLVCRAWNDLILNTKFLISNGFFAFTQDINHSHNPNANVRMHCIDLGTLSSVASFELDVAYFEGITFPNPCNGLFYISKWKPSVYYGMSNPTNSCTRCDGILNPMTNEFFPVPRMFKPKVQGRSIKAHRFGFGFSPKTKRYKLFRVTFELLSSCSKIEVFRFGTNRQWSLIHTSLPFALYEDGVYLNGFIYWMVRKAFYDFLIYALEVETENFEKIGVLNIGDSISISKFELFNGSIYAIFYVMKSSTIQVWKMLEKDSWVRDFIFDGKEFSYCAVGQLRFVKAFEDGSMLVLIKNEYLLLDRMGRKILIKTFDQNARLVYHTSHISSLNFGSLSSILGERYPLRRKDYVPT